MRDKKFRYTFKHVETGVIEQKIYTLSQLEELNTKELSPYFNVDFGYELIGRDDFTGLRDKNGKEIYEGDILEGIESDPFGKVYSRWTGRVYWDNEKASFYIVDDVSELYNVDDFEFDIVIGNIHKNPELLDKNNL